LLALKGAAALEPHLALQLLQLALQLRVVEPIEQLCKLEVVKQLTAAHVEETLQLALRTRACADQAVVLLLDLPAAQQLSSCSVSTLLQQAASNGAMQAVTRLCELSGAEQIGCQAAAAVLDAASLEQLDSPAVAALCRLPGVQQLPAGDVSSMLRGVLRKDSYSVPVAATALAQQLLQLPGASGIPADVLTELLQIGTQRNSQRMNAEVMQALFKLHAAALRRPRV
jgi:anti-anti-sigma regulatory factor